MKAAEKTRCPWAPADNAEYVRYHDEEWGVPSHDDAHLFEMMTLEGAQAGLSWATILKKREGYRKAFAKFDPAKVAKFDEAKQATLLLDATIVRHPGKIASTISNASAFRAVQKEHGSFATYLWSFVDGKPVDNARKSMSEVPASTEISKALSKDLLKRGFRFVGPTTMYAMMQAVGLVNDHLLTCFRYRELGGLRKR